MCVLDGVQKGTAVQSFICSPGALLSNPKASLLIWY